MFTQMQAQLQQAQQQPPTPAVHTPLRVPSAAIVKPEPFNGKKNGDVDAHRFLAKMSSVFEMTGVSTDRTRILSVGLNLTGEASNWFYTEGERMQEWDTFVTAFTTKFSPLDEQLKANDELRRLLSSSVPTGKLSLSEFSSRVFRLATLAGVVAEDFTVMSYIDCLPKQVRESTRERIYLNREVFQVDGKLSLRKVMDFADRTAAVKYEAAATTASHPAPSHSARQPAQIVAHPSSIASSSSDMELSQLEHKYDDTAAEQTYEDRLAIANLQAMWSEEYKKLYAEGKCWYCKQVGHNKQQCPEYKLKKTQGKKVSKK